MNIETETGWRKIAWFRGYEGQYYSGDLTVVPHKHRGHTLCFRIYLGNEWIGRKGCAYPTAAAAKNAAAQLAEVRKIAQGPNGDGGITTQNCKTHR